MRLRGKVAIVAGAGGGMGRAVPALFAREGAKVLLVARRREPLEELAGEIRARGGEARVATADLTTRAGAETMAAAALEAFGRIDVLYNNLGDAAASGIPPHETSDEDWEYLVRINLDCAFLVSRAVLPTMLRQGGGSIIHASAAQHVRLRANAGYSAAKAGLIELCRRLAREYRPHGIRVNCICPGSIGGSRGAADFDPPPATLVRPAHPADVAYAALYFASDESAWVTGQVLEIDGGASLG
jgi:NAD(P)-dependent dehydrogenase (short-subunit alcohol dehydrogenase family)